MAVDVLRKCKAAAPFRNGCAVVASDKFGNIEVEADNIQVGQPDETATFNKLNTRFDDVQYYST